MKESPYKRNHDFTVTRFDRCDVCAGMVKEGEVKKRTRYVYPVGYTELVSCQPCFNKAVEAAQTQAKADAKAYTDGLYGDLQ